MAKRALLVGCNYPGTKAALRGCSNDVRRMQTTLLEMYGFPEEDVTVMTDVCEEHVRPTGKNIKAKLQELIDASEDGDVLYFHFSGHGVQVPAETGDEEDDGKDEAICPTDLNILTDDDFRVLFKGLKAGVKFTFVSDSCHSGGLLDSEEVQVGVADDGELGDETEPVDGSESHGPDSDSAPASANKSIPIELLQELLSERTGSPVTAGTIRTTLFDMFGPHSSPTVKAFVGQIASRVAVGDSEEDIAERYGQEGQLAMEYLRRKMDDDSVDNDDYFRSAHDLEGPLDRSGHARAKPEPQLRLPLSTGVLISGCQSNQTSADATPSSDPDAAYGALSDAIQTVLSQSGGRITNGDLSNEVRRLLRRSKFTQRPCLYCSDEAVDSPFICDPLY